MEFSVFTNKLLAFFAVALYHVGREASAENFLKNQTAQICLRARTDITLIGHVYRQFSGKSFLYCGITCKNIFERCLSFNYCSDTKVCTLNSGNSVKYPQDMTVTKGCSYYDIEPAFCNPKCLNGGTCVGHNRCSCPRGFMGAMCEAGRHLPRDCSDALLSGKASGVYRIQPLDQGEPIQVVCDMETDGGGWMVFQRRQDGSVEFYLNWVDYRQGFGDLNGEFWLGNDNISRISSQGEYELRVDLTDFEDKSAYAAYSTFSVGNENQIYILAATGYTGTAGDSLARHNDQPFSTKDHGNVGNNCAQKYHGAWWYMSCYDSNLNGKYLRGYFTGVPGGVVWRAWKGYYYSLKTTEMKMRRKI